MSKIDFPRASLLLHVIEEASRHGYQKLVAEARAELDSMLVADAPKAERPSPRVYPESSGVVERKL